MPLSENKLAANRRNAQKSSGPKTASGKQSASRNALKHGLYSDGLIIRSPYLTEDDTDYDRLLASLTEELKPETIFQECLVRKIADYLWRSRRVVAAESAHIMEELGDIDSDIETGEAHRRFVANLSGREHSKPSPRAQKMERLNCAARSLVPGGEYTHDLLRYEMRLDRQLTRCYLLLRQLKQSAEAAKEQTTSPETRKK